MGKEKKHALALPPPPPIPALSVEQAAEIELRFGTGGIRVGARMTPAGLLAVGGMVWGILLSTAVLVRAAKR
jgi:hypothetical protein